MKKLGKITIIDTEYTVFTYGDGEFKQLQDDANERDTRYLGEPRTGTIDGYCDYMQKEIRVYDDKYTDRKYFEMTLRHEITHAFLYEIGYAHHDDEEFIEKLSKWVPLLEKYFQRGKIMIETRSAWYSKDV